MSDITQLLEAVGKGLDPSAPEELLKAVYEELRLIARAKMAKEKPGHTLQPTILVHDAWLKLMAGPHKPQFNHRAHFFAAAAKTMHRFLVDHARRRNAQKRGQRVEESDTWFAELAHPAPDEVLLRVDEVLADLAKEDESTVKLVDLRFFIGLSMEQAAEALNMPLRTAERKWTYFRAQFRKRFGEVIE